ncbi:hypothetical protein PMAC_001556 [Pneumocystis sp. 'macacae']|nr:hypothetical protein PMAC_001556 [Pneumocystis sp. 'macacae']
MQEIVFVTGNVKKAEEIKAICDIEFELTCVFLELPEIQGELHEIVIDKCKRAADIVKKPVIVEDTSLFFIALNGLPGPYIKWFLSSLGLDGLVRILIPFSDKTAEAVCIFAYCEGPGHDVHIFEGKTQVIRNSGLSYLHFQGTIVSARGPSVFGWDPIFQPFNSHQTYAEMDCSLKCMLSHRTKALMKLLSFLKNIIRNENKDSS